VTDTHLHALKRGTSPGTVSLSKLTPRERATIVKRVKELNTKIQNPRLSIERIDDLHKERAELTARLLEDRASQ
jgi:hypothetical protein